MSDEEVTFTQDDVGNALTALTGLALYIQESYGVPGITFDSEDGTTCIIISVDEQATQEIKVRAGELGLDYDDSSLGADPNDSSTED